MRTGADHWEPGHTRRERHPDLHDCPNATARGSGCDELDGHHGNDRAFVATSSLLDELRRSTSFSLQASAAYARLAQSLGEQETAVSGYLLSGSETCLDQYYNGAAAEQLAYESIEGTLDSVGAIDQGFDRVRQAMTEWRAVYAAPTIDDVRFDRMASATSTIRQQAGKGLFDQVRAQSAALSRPRSTP